MKLKMRVMAAVLVSALAAVGCAVGPGVVDGPALEMRDQMLRLVTCEALDRRPNTYSVNEAWDSPCRQSGL